MRRLMIICFAALVFSAAASGQRPFYDVCESNEQTWVDFQRERISVDRLTSDSLVFLSGSVTYTANKVSGQEFLEGGKDETHFFAYRVDDNSFFIVSPAVDAFAYYHADKSRADQADNNKRCQVEALNRFESLVKPYAQKQKSTSISDYEARTKAITTEYVKNLKSKRVDPLLERDIMKWWKGPDPANIPDPVLGIYFLMADYGYTRNDYGTVLRKTIDALILWKERTGTKCWVQWRSFGYESLGAGVFDKNMSMWTRTAYLDLPEYRHFHAGEWSEVDCTPFVKSRT
jgi:hypothetical protein